MKKKHLLRLWLIALLAVLGSGTTLAAGYTRTLNESLEVAGYKVKQFYNFQTNTPAVLPESGDLRYRTGNIWGLHNFASGGRSGTATIPVAEGDIIVLQLYSSNYVPTINRGALNETLTASTSPYYVYDITTTADDITFTVPRYGGIVAALVMEKDASVALADYTINYQFEGTTVFSEGASVNVGTDITAKKAVEDTEGNRYIVIDATLPTLTVTANANENILNVPVRQAEKWSYTVASAFASQQLSWSVEGQVWEDQNTTTVSYPRFQAFGKQLVERKPVSNNLQTSVTTTSEGQIHTLDYVATSPAITDLYLLSEAENLETGLSTSATSFTSRVSGGLIIYGTSGNLFTLPAGKYIVTLGAIGAPNNGSVDYEIFAADKDSQSDDNKIGSGTCSGNTLVLINSDEFEIDEETTISFTSSNPASTRGLDVVYVRRLFSEKYAIVNAGFDLSEAATADVMTAEGAQGTDYASTGWKIGQTAAWSNGAVIAYGSTTKLNNESIPQTDNAGHGGNALAITVGWSGTTTYQSAEPIELPAGTYTLMAYAYNANGSAQQMQSKLGFVSTSGTEYISSANSYLSNKWNIDYVTFTLTEATEGRFQVGGTAISGGSGANAKVFFDNLQLVSSEELAAAQAEIDRINATIDLIAEIVVAEGILANEQKTEGRNEFAQAIEAARAAQQTAANADDVATAINTLKAAEEQFLRANLPVQEGVYYVYNAYSKKFLSRGDAWGTRAVVDDYGLPVALAATNLADGIYTLQGLDNGMYYGDDYWMYADCTGNRQRQYQFEKTEGGIFLHNTARNVADNRMYVYMKDDADKWAVAGNAALGDNISDEQQTVWQFITADDRNAIIAARNAEAKAAAFEAAGYGLEDQMEEQTATTLTFKTGSEWAFTAKRNGSSHTTNNNGTEVFKGTGTFTQNVSGLEAGLYKVSIQAFFRACQNTRCTDYLNQGYELSTAYLTANGNSIQVKGWAEDQTSETEPNSMDAAAAAFANGQYLSEGYAYVGEDGVLNLSVTTPTFMEIASNNWWDASWFIADNVTYTQVKSLTQLNNELAEVQQQAKELIRQPMNGDIKEELQSTYDDTKLAENAASALEQAISSLREAIETAQASAQAYTVVPLVSASINATNVYTVEAYTTFRQRHLDVVKQYNNRTLTDDEADAYREEVFGTEGQPGTIATVLLSAWQQNDNLSVAVPEVVGSAIEAPFIMVNGTEAKAQMTHVEPGVYDITARVATSAEGVTFLATGMEEALTISGNELSAQAIVAEDGVLDFTFNVPAEAQLSLRDLYFELNAQATTDKEKADEQKAAAADLAKAREELQKALDSAKALLESTDLTKADEQTVSNLNDAIAAAEQLLADETVPETTSDLVAKTREVNAAATALRTAGIELKKSIAVGIATIETGARQQGNIFTVQGRKVQDPNRKGLYIINGKKTVVK